MDEKEPVPRRHVGIVSLAQREPACAKVLGQNQVWCVGETICGPMWLEQSGQGREKQGRGQGRSCQALGTMGRTWAFTQGGGSPGRVERSPLTFEKFHLATAGSMNPRRAGGALGGPE